VVRLTNIPVPQRPQKITIVKLPHDARAVVEFESATLSSSLKATVAFLYVFLLSFLLLVYLSYPSLTTAVLLMLVVISSTWLIYHFVFRSR